MKYGPPIDESYLTEHPEGKIRLLNARLIDGYPKEQGPENSQNYPLNPFDVPESTLDLFVENAFLLYMHRWLIVQDSRMFLTPLWVPNILAYTGHYGFRRPILGTYIEWWSNCKSSKVYQSKGHFSLIYQMGGSPLSGSNCCFTVDSNGQIGKTSLTSWRNAYIPFVSINIRYNPCKDAYEAYPLERTIEILKEFDEKNRRYIKQK